MASPSTLSRRTTQLSSGGAPLSWNSQKRIVPRRLLQRLVHFRLAEASRTSQEL